ncbi:peptidoglycan-binding domain-containing protein [Sinorhizobium meliloti]|uniref:peptidoglycan-binding domain-containing protein n=1 Tax=Rhizobium meliloti TaxID=382 RepID=UPI001914992B|nr:peptidoglycan-binding domain-containing protein [Sinorhizobium meliloti]
MRDRLHFGSKCLTLVAAALLFFHISSDSGECADQSVFTLDRPASRVFPLTASELLLYSEGDGSLATLNLNAGSSKNVVTVGKGIIDLAVRAQTSADVQGSADFIGAAILEATEVNEQKYLLIFDRTRVLLKRKFPSHYAKPKIFISNTGIIFVYDTAGPSVWMVRSKYSGFKTSNTRFDDFVSTNFADGLRSINYQPIAAFEYAGAGSLYFAFQPLVGSISLLRIEGLAGGEFIEQVDHVRLESSEREFSGESVFPQSALLSIEPQTMFWAHRIRGSLSFLEYYREFNALNRPISLQIDPSVLRQRAGGRMLLATNAKQEVAVVARQFSSRIQLFRRIKKGMVSLGVYDAGFPLHEVAFAPARNPILADTLLLITGDGTTIRLRSAPYFEDERDSGSTSSLVGPLGYAELQKYLLLLGYSPGAVDGILGTMTRTSLRSFQRDVGLKPSGDLDPETEAALKEKVGMFVNESVQKLDDKSIAVRRKAVQDLMDFGAESVVYEKLLDRIINKNKDLSTQGLLNTLHVLSAKATFNASEKERMMEAIAVLENSDALGNLLGPPTTRQLINNLKDRVR